MTGIGSGRGRGAWLALLLSASLSGCGGGGGGNSSPYAGRLDPIAGQWVQYGTGTGRIGKLSNPWTFPSQQSGVSVNYVYTAPVYVAGKTLTLDYGIVGNATFAPIPESNCGSGGCGPAKIRLFLWNTNPDTNNDRWWCPAPQDLAIGHHVLSCVVDNTWTGVQGQKASGNWANGLFAMGFTFGGMFAGHGVWATSGTATFQINAYGAQ